MDTSIQTMRCERALWVRVAGPATLKAAPTFLECLNEARSAAVEHVWIDLSACTWLDSTFAGALIGAFKVSRKEGTPAIHLHSPSEGCLKNLRQMNLDRLLSIECCSNPPAGEWDTRLMEGASRDDLADVVIQAHEELASADPRNQPFGHVADVFRQDIQKNRAARMRSARSG